MTDEKPGIHRLRRDLAQACMELASSELISPTNASKTRHVEFAGGWVDDAARDLVRELQNREPMPEVEEFRKGPTGIEILVEGRWIHLCYSGDFEDLDEYVSRFYGESA